MPITIALAIGFDPWLLASKKSAWRSAGYFVTEAGSIAAALDQLRDSDFDLVLLDPSIPAAKREEITERVRGFGSLIPIICLTDPSAGRSAFSAGPNDLDTQHRSSAEHFAAPKRPAPARFSLADADRHCA